jgi:hypothetical protein
MYVNAASWLGYSILSFSQEINEEKNIFNFSIGYEMVFDGLILSPNIKWGNENVAMDFYWIVTPPVKYWIHFGEGDDGILYGLGAYISYNFTESIFGISPLIELTYCPFVPIVKFHLTYKYNVYFLSGNSNEVAFKISLMNIFSMARSF